MLKHRKPPSSRNQVSTMPPRRCSTYTMAELHQMAHAAGIEGLQTREALCEALAIEPTRFPEKPRRYLLTHYTKIRVLGEGNFGAVSLYQTAGSGVVVAIKKFKSDANHVRASLKEVQLMQMIARAPNCQRNLACLIDYFKIESSFYIVSSYVNGVNLKTLLNETHAQYPNMQVNQKMITLVAGDLLTGIQYLHRASIAHADVKPDNIMVEGVAINGQGYHQSDNARVVLIDVGVACVTTNPPHLPKCGLLHGTPLYASPEVIHRQRGNNRFGVTIEYTPRLFKSNDIYSLSLVLYDVAKLSGEAVHSRFMTLNNNSEYFLADNLTLFAHRLMDEEFLPDRPRMQRLIRLMNVQYHIQRPSARLCLQYLNSRDALPSVTIPAPIYLASYPAYNVHLQVAAASAASAAVSGYETTVD
jgi:serine/threonine protein kinase